MSGMNQRRVKMHHLFVTSASRRRALFTMSAQERDSKPLQPARTQSRVHGWRA
jgi:hypothetical protein